MVTIGFLSGLSVVGAEVGKVSFDQVSAYKVPKELLLFNTQTKAGTPFDEKILNEDIKRLYATGFFSDVVAETSKELDGKVNVTIKLTAKTRIRKIIFQGNKKYKKKTLDEHIQLSPETPLNDKNLQKSASNLRKYYHDEGYTDAQVTPLVKKTEQPGYVDVIFDIKEHLKLKVGSVTFAGNTVYSSWRLRRTIYNQHSYLSWIPFLNLGLFNRSELKKDEVRLRELFWDKGYLDFKIKKLEVVEDKENPEYVDITFDIDEGKPYIVSNITVTGNERFTKEDIIQLVQVKTGQVYDNQEVREDIESIGDLYYPLGYADFICTAERSPDYETHTVDIDFQIKPGRVYRVRDVNISGNTITKDYVIRREVALQPGDLLNNELVTISKDRIMGLDYFNKVDAASVNTSAPNQKDVDIKVSEKETIKFNIGGGWSDTDGLVGVIGASQSNFDITDPGNYFQGGGQRLHAQAMIGVEEWGGVIGFSEPWLFGIPLKLDINGYSRAREYQKWRETRIGGEIALSKKVFDDFTTMSLGYRMEAVRIDRMNKDLSEWFQKQKGTDRVFTLSLAMNRDTRDNAAYPTSGYAFNFLSEVTSKMLGASNDYYRLEAKGIQYFSFLDKALILHIGGKIGTVQSFGNDDVPLYERYFLGGGDTIRGFPYREVSPVDSNGDFYGGESMVLFTAEMSHPIYEFLRGAVFVDAGGSFPNAWDYNLDNFNVGAGYGLRIFIPQVKHPIRLDLAYPVLNNQKDVDSKLRFHFNVGFNW